MSVKRSNGPHSGPYLAGVWTVNFYQFKIGGTFEEYAQCIATGTWSPGQLTTCCQRSTSYLAPPLQLMWIPGSDVIGDFVWDPGLFVVQDTVIPSFKTISTTCWTDPVEFVPYDGCAGRLKKKTRIVTLPYTGPPLHWLRVPADVPMDLSASGIGITRTCNTCGFVWLDSRKTGLVLRRGEWRGQHVFRLSQFPNSTAMFTTEIGKDVLQNANVKFSLAGEIR